ncbi:MAG TPA: phosphate acyltransferase, partial [Anaeromyxobacteraceae bacterium]|nr:phosphate acyltransferase [Anaeromyxobacteraceae bacterium]
VGGAPLLGVNGVGFITHGRSDALAIENAIRRAREAARAHFTDEIARAVVDSEALLAEPDGTPPVTVSAEAETTPRRPAPREA